MTGFGSASLRERRMDIGVEVRSVNHRFLTIKISLPDALARRENEIEQLIRGRLGRGSVSVSVSVKTPRDADPSLPDLSTFQAVAKQLRDIQKALGLKGEIRMEDLLAVPSLWSNGSAESDEDLWPRVKKLLPKALDELVETREREGKKIAGAFEQHLGNIEGRLGKVQSRVPAVVETYQKRLDDRIQQLLTQRGLEAAKLDIVKEVAIHADRCDTSEEIQRLRAHIGEFRKIAGQKGQLGRRLDFLTQEMGRETNTIASKANDGEIAACAVEMKADLEKIKEQVENVE
ncbi:MAG TPA: YicC/YloC family endoribonuclease [Planctomycetota bacterium]|nr:YicC/YloC family endoribonuclease [Planctomycetota bacterium]